MPISNTIRLRSFFKSIYHKLAKEDDCLPSLKEIIDITRARKESYVGLRTIPVDNIIGSEDRYNDFNKDFLPKKAELKDRWALINKISEENKPLPPISVFKIDDYYFVRDGNHRVSVAKSRNQQFIEAEVTEYFIDVPLTKDLTIEDRLNIQEHVNFLNVTGLNELGKGYDIKLTRPRSYRLLLNIIQHFKAPLEENLGKELTLKEVSQEWYAQVFLPFAEGAYLEDLLTKFPNRTTGDLYVWMQMNWNEVKNSLGHRMTFLAKPISTEEGGKQSGVEIQLSGETHRLHNAYLRANIGLLVTCTILNISSEGEISIAIVKRKYHPFEGYWSLPIAIINENETRYDGADRCVKDSLGLQRKIQFVHYKTFDNIDRNPYGRMVAMGMIGIYFGENMRISAGGLASEIKLISLKDKTPLVYDHRDIFDGALEYIYRIRNNFSFIKELFPEDIPLKHVRKLLWEVRAIQHEHERNEQKGGLFGGRL